MLYGCVCVGIISDMMWVRRYGDFEKSWIKIRLYIIKFYLKII